MRAGHRLSGGVEGCSSGIVWGENIVGSELCECRRTHTLFEYPLGKPLEAKLLKELFSSLLQPCACSVACHDHNHVHIRSDTFGVSVRDARLTPREIVIVLIVVFRTDIRPHNGMVGGN